MTIDSLKDLEKLIRLCRKTGITSFKGSDFEFQLGVEPHKNTKRMVLEDPIANLQVPEPNLFDPIAQAKQAAAKALQDIQDYIQTDEPTPEQMMMWSSKPEPGHETQ